MPLQSDLMAVSEGVRLGRDSRRAGLAAAVAVLAVLLAGRIRGDDAAFPSARSGCTRPAPTRTPRWPPPGWGYGKVDHDRIGPVLLQLGFHVLVYAGVGIIVLSYCIAILSILPWERLATASAAPGWTAPDATPATA